MILHIFLILLNKRRIPGRKEVKNVVLVISCIVGYKQLTEYYDNVQILYKCTVTAEQLMCTAQLVTA